MRLLGSSRAHSSQFESSNVRVDRPEHRPHKGPVDETSVLGTAALPPLFARSAPGTARVTGVSQDFSTGTQRESRGMQEAREQTLATTRRPSAAAQDEAVF